MCCAASSAGLLRSLHRARLGSALFSLHLPRPVDMMIRVMEPLQLSLLSRTFPLPLNRSFVFAKSVPETHPALAIVVGLTVLEIL